MHLCLILFPGFPMLGYVLIREVVRLANACSGQTLFTCTIRTVTGAPVQADDGTEIRADAADWEGAQGYDLMVLCSGASPLDHLPMGLRGFLARGAQAGATLAGLDQGAVILAKLGFLAGREAVLPDISHEAVSARHPDIALSQRTHVYDRGRLTSAGGIPTGEALIAWIARAHGAALAAQVGTALAQGRLADSAARQRLARSTDPVLDRMRSVMAAHLGDPLPLPRIAAELELSPKQLRLRSQKGLGQTPAAVYLALRLDRAAQLVDDTALSVKEIADATGFASASAFTRSYKRRFGRPPRDERKALKSKPGAAAHAPAQDWQADTMATRPSASPPRQTQGAEAQG